MVTNPEKPHNTNGFDGYQAPVTFGNSVTLRGKKTMQVSEIKKNMLKPVIFRDIRWILVEYIYWIDEKERKAKHSVTLREENNRLSFCRAPIEQVEVIENG